MRATWIAPWRPRAPRSRRAPGRTCCRRDREALLWKLSDLIEKNADELAELESLNNGKTKFMASIVDVPGTRDYFRYMAGWATKIEGVHLPDLDPRAAGREVPHLLHARAGRRGGADRAVEFPARHGGVEARAGAGHRLHRAC